VKRLIAVIIVTFFVASIFAQDRKTAKAERKKEKQDRVNALIKQEEEGALIYSKQTSFGLQLRTNGYGGFVELGCLKTRRKSNLYTLELTEIKDAKEEKSSNGFLSFNPYIYAKQNNFYQAKLGFGQQYLLGQKGNKNGVAVLIIYHGGLSLGLLRPYYLEVEDNGKTRKIKYSQQDSSLFLSTNPDIVKGSAGLGKGWNELKLKPGAYAKGAIRFDYGRYNEIVSGIEIGISVDAYSQKIPIMVFGDPRQFFFQGHIAIVFGRRR